MSQEAKNREKYLLWVLQYDSQYERVFTAFERIYIHYERARLLRDEHFKQPPELEQKVQDVLMRIQRMNWQPYKF